MEKEKDSHFAIRSEVSEENKRKSKRKKVSIAREAQRKVLADLVGKLCISTA